MKTLKRIEVLNKSHGIRNKNKKRGYITGTYIGRPSIFGNPYSDKANTLAKYRTNTRDEAISSYDEYFYKMMGNGGEFYNKMIELLTEYLTKGELTLICWCKPLPCHGDIIARWLETAAEALSFTIDEKK